MRSLLPVLQRFFSRLVNLDTILGTWAFTELFLFPIINSCFKDPDGGRFFEWMGIALLSQCVSGFLMRKIMIYQISSGRTPSDRQRIMDEMSQFIFNRIEISICAIVAAVFFITTVYMDGDTVQNMELWQPLAIFPSLWFANIYTCIIFRGFGISIPAYLLEPLSTTSNENTQPIRDRSHHAVPQPSQSHTQRNQNRPRNNRPQRTRTAANNPRVPLIAPPTATTSPIPTYGSFSQPELPLPDYESLLAPPPSYAEITKKTNQPPNHPQPPLDTTLNPISMLLYPSLSALLRQSPISSEYIALEEGSQQSADDNSAPSPSAPLLSEEESQQSADDDSVPSPSAPPFFP